MKTRSNYARSIRYSALVTMIAATSVVQACSSDTILAVPSSASRTPASAPSSAPATQIRVSGTVTDDEGAPVAGAKVTVYRWTGSGEPRSTVTDGSGFYSMSFVAAGGISIRAEKEGYESAWHNRSTSPAADFQLDLRVHRIKK